MYEVFWVGGLGGGVRQANKGVEPGCGRFPPEKSLKTRYLEVHKNFQVRRGLGPG